MSATAMTADSQAIALLCSRLGLGGGGDLKPLTPSNWSALAVRIHNSPLKRPGALIGLGAAELADALELERTAAQRICELLSRGGQLALELERLASRGIWLLTRADDEYPALLRKQLRQTAPPLLFGAGRVELLAQRAVAVIGSRDADQDSLDFATTIGRRLAGAGLAVVSGAAQGVDSAAMLGAVDADGTAVGVVAEALERAVRRQDLRTHLADGTVVLVSAYHPGARFTVGQAMGRNRLIYCLAEAAVVVTSGATGGTWTGAVENLKARWVPLFVREDGERDGNRLLIAQGGVPLSRQAVDESEFLTTLGEQPMLAPTLFEL